MIANSRNLRQDSFADVVERGDIITSDGVVIATSTTDEEGNTYRSYPYSNMFAHVVGYESRGKSGLELAGNFYMLPILILLNGFIRSFQKRKTVGIMLLQRLIMSCKMPPIMQWAAVMVQLLYLNRQPERFFA